MKASSILQRDLNVSSICILIVIVMYSIWHRQQEQLKRRLSGRIRELLGWERGQYGDAVCFLAVAYRNQNNMIQEAGLDFLSPRSLIVSHGLTFYRFMASNCPECLKSYDPFVVCFKETMGGELSATSSRVLPSKFVSYLIILTQTLSVHRT